MPFPVRSLTVVTDDHTSKICADCRASSKQSWSALAGCVRLPLSTRFARASRSRVRWAALRRRGRCVGIGCGRLSWFGYKIESAHITEGSPNRV